MKLPAGCRSIAWCLLAAAVASLSEACVSAEKFRSPNRPGGKYLVHVVSTDGETLRQISDWYAGDADAQKQIESANPGQNLSTLTVGQRVLIPYSVVKRLEPLGPGLPRPAKQGSPDSATDAEDLPPAGAALDDDFVDLPDKSAPSEGAQPAAPKSQLAKPTAKKPAEPKPQPPAASEQQAVPAKPLDPLEELAISAEKAQRQRPPGQPVGIEDPSAGMETFDLSPAESEPQVPDVTQVEAQPARPSGAQAAPAPQVDPSVDELRRDLGLSK